MNRTGTSTAFLPKVIYRNPLLWLLALVPAVLVGQMLIPEEHTLLFVLSVFAILPLATLLSHATESVAAKTGDTVGGLLNATLGNLTELIIALAALQAGQYVLVKASIAGSIVTNALFMLGASFLLGGIKHHVQEYNRVSARFQAGLLFLATIALLIPSAIAERNSAANASFTQLLSVSIAVLLIITYALGMAFSLKTHRELFTSVHSAETDEAPWPAGVALAVLAGVTVLIALVSEVFVGIGSARDPRPRDDPGIRGVHRCGAGRGCGGDGFGILWRSQEPTRSECWHRVRERDPNRALRRPGVGPSELCHRSDAYGPSILARRGSHDADRDADRCVGDQQRALGLVRRSADPDGVPDLCADAVPIAFTGTVTGRLVR